VIQTKQVGVTNPDGDDFLAMLLDRKIVEDIVTICKHSDFKLVGHYAFAIYFENTFATGRESGIHRHINELVIDISEVEIAGRFAYPVHAYLDIPISAYERMRSHTPSKRNEKDSFPPLTVLNQSG